MDRTSIWIIVTLALSMVSSQAGVSEQMGLAGPAARTRDGVSAEDWSAICAAYQASRHTAVPVDGGWNAPNPGQNWLTRFDGRGFEVSPRCGDWSWGLALGRWGRAGAEHAVTEPALVTASGRRVAYEWEADLTEWWVNDTPGLKHGFTVCERPQGDGRLTFVFEVRGELIPSASVDGRDVMFVNGLGARVLNYAGLMVFDADGVPLEAAFAVDGDRLRLTVDDAGARYPVTVDPLVQQAYLKASNTDPMDYFGSSVAASGSTVVVGALAEDSKSPGVNGDETDDNLSYAGAAYVFVRSGTTWSQQAYLKASNPDAGDQFGMSVAIDGNTIVVGAAGEDGGSKGVGGSQSDNSASTAGAAYVFVRSGTTWSQQAYLKASNTAPLDLFGDSVSVDGNIIVVGARGEDSNATGVNGDQASDAALESGAAYVFFRNGTTWTQQAYLKASNTQAADQFGGEVAISRNTVVVGATGEDSQATGVNGNQTNNSASGSGAAYVFRQNGTAWTQEAYLKASNTGTSDTFSISVAIYDDTIVVGAIGEDSSAKGVNGNQGDDPLFGTDSGAAYVFLRSGTSWAQQAYLKASNTNVDDFFGQSVAITGHTVVIGGYHERSSATGVNGDEGDNSLWRAGAAYVFLRTGTTWAQTAYLKASNTGFDDNFGGAVAIAGDVVVVGAAAEDSGASGINGDQEDDSTSSSGAVYVFDNCTSLADATKYGTGKPGTFGVPALSSTVPPKLGATSNLTISNGKPGATPVLLIVGLTPTALPFDGGTLLVNPTIVISLPPLNAGGVLTLPIPVTAWWCGQHVYFQAMISDAGATGFYHLAQTPGLDWTIGS